jgi:hypothetical protein
VSEGLRTIALAFAALGVGFTWQAVTTSAIPANAPDRLIAELRLSQVAAMLLALTAGMSLGVAASHEQVPGVSFDVALAVGFFVCATAMLVRDPRQALTVLALAFAAHAVFDIAHRPGSVLPDGVVPRWFTVGGAVYDVYISALCYLPILRRS